MGPDVDSSNLTQLAHWDGAGGGFWAEYADAFDAGIAGYQDRFVRATAITPTSQVLDVGCGNGRTTRDVARAAPDGAALGVDLSAEMLEVARRRARADGLGNVTFEQADAQVHAFPAQYFDVVVSRHGAMFFGDPVAAFTNLGRALRPGGRLVLLTWQPFEQQEWLRSFLTILSAGGPVPVPPSDAPSPFALSDPDRVRGLLSAAGFTDVTLDGLSAPMNHGPDLDAAVRFVAGQRAGMLEELDDDRRRDALAALREDLAAHRGEEGIVYDSATWLIRARKP
jgi:SAM-dependent methyltransferase